MNLASNIVKAVNQAGYEVSCIAFSSILAAEASLNKKLKIDGCMVVDIGATTTSVLVFKDGFLRELDIIQLGGDHLTSGLAEALKLPLSLAEEIKKSYAAATRDDERQDQEILIKKEAEYVPLKRDAICQAIEPEVLRLVNSIENTIKCSRFQGQIDSEILMVGGGSLLSGLIERIEKAAHLPVHIGKVNIALNKLSNPVIFSAAAGLAQAGFNQSLHHILSSDDHASRTGQIKAKIKEWYQDYF